MERLEPELKQIVKRSTTQIADHAYQRGEGLSQESQPWYGMKTGSAGLAHKSWKALWWNIMDSWE